jgi:hypothetical protein
MARLRTQAQAVALIGAAAAGWAGLAHACEGVGVITRIEGRAQDVVIMRTEAGTTRAVSRPRVLEVVCYNDTITAVGATYLVLSLEGSAPIKVDHNAAYTVPLPRGSQSVLGNAYSALSDRLMPDMKRLPWTVRLKGAGDDFGFAVPALTAGGQQLRVGDRALLVRLVGGTAPYKVEIRDDRNAVVASQISPDHDVILPHVTLKAGAYQVTASDATPRSLDAAIVAVDTVPPADTSFDSFTDPEVRIAAMAANLARNSPALWSFEAEQELQSAPANGLDRDKVYELIESYGTD